VSRRLATCRVCLAQGYEEPDDVAPGICPPCLERTMARLTVEFDDLCRTQGLAVALGRIRDEMVVSGLTPEAAESFLGVAVVLAATEDEETTT